MIASLIIVFREVLEAGLIVGIVLAATTTVPGRGRWVAGGILTGVLGACLVAMFAGSISAAVQGMGQEIFTAAILLVAVCMLGWHNVWMATHGRELATSARQLGRSVSAGDRSLTALATVVAIAVLREGSEVVLFLYGIAAGSKVGAGAILTGGLLGIAAGGLVSLALYRGLLAIPVQRLFGVTQWMIALLAAGMAGQAAALLATDDLIPSWGDQVWNTSAFLSDEGWIGRTLHVLVGYTARPMGVQLAAWVVTLVTLTTLERIVRQRMSSLRSTVPMAQVSPG